MAARVLAGRYELAGLLGRGGMGTVHRAIDRRTGGVVAVKLLGAALSSDPVYVARLHREARIAASIASPRIVRVTDLDSDGDDTFLVMEYVPGRTLAATLAERGRYPLGEAVWICREVARALEAAHAGGIVHRDLKPQNIMLVDGQVKVLDFGIARRQGDPDLTASGAYLGTPAYSAPEMTAGQADIRSDIYALGAILFTLITGQPPFRGPAPLAVLFQHATAPLPELPDGTPPEVRAIVHRCLAKSPSGRYPSAVEVTAALTTALRALPPADGALEVAPPALPATAGLPEVTSDGLTVTGAAPRLQPAPSGRDAFSLTAAPTVVPAHPPLAHGSAPAGGRALPPFTRGRRRRAVMIGAVIGAVGLAGAALLTVPGLGEFRTPPSADADPPARSTPGPGQGKVQAGASTIAANGAPVTVQLGQPGGTMRLTFTGGTGQYLALGFSGVRPGAPDCCIEATVLDPNGGVIASTSVGLRGDALYLDAPLPADGLYSILLDAGANRDAALTLYLSEDIQAQLAVDGPALQLDLTRPGQRARLAFSGAAHQRLDVRVEQLWGGVMPCCLFATVIDPQNALLTWNDVIVEPGGISRLALTVTGRHTLLLQPDHDMRAARLSVALIDAGR